MDLHDLAAELNTDIGSAAAGLADDAPGAPRFTIPANRFHVHKAKAELRASRRGIKSLIRPENAEAITEHLPAPDDHMHCILRGDFVLCDIIPAIIARHGPLLDVHIATLGLSTANALTLADLKRRGLIASLTIICSLYFRQVDRATTFREVAAALNGVARLVIVRSHAKVI